MKTLEFLLQGLPCDVRGSSQVGVEDIAFDSRKIKKGSLFVALQGVHQDGRAFIDRAVKAGASAVLAEGEVVPGSVTRVQVSNALKALAHVSVRFWDNPSSKLRLVGITGTNGKTTTSYLVESIFRHVGWPTGVLGTINYRFGNESMPAPNTTPFASDVQRFLSDILQRGAQACIMEVSSHALELSRVEGVDFDVAVLTNLTQDHLDFHKTMEAYAAAKSKLFTSIGPRSSKAFPRCTVLNADDPWVQKGFGSARVPKLLYRLTGPADLSTKDLVCEATGSRFLLCTPSGNHPVRLPLVGDYNVMNALAAAGVALSQGLAVPDIVEGLETVSMVPGRMERIPSRRGFTVVVDYAHTEDALRKAMAALRKLNPRRLITVFGCGGDRDRAKRPLMGEAAAQMSDEVIVTSDNPRSEDPGRIALDVEVGVRRVRSNHYEIILDREQALQKAIALATEGDLVLVAGKGHENYQILSDRTVPFDDRLVVRQLLETLA